eukprot:10601258-Prorocentrum_lima.AAC.1
MTSSLVGSEMCIRDRDKYGSYPTIPTTIKLTDRADGRNSRIMFAKYYICLLYTSDAADDM